MKRENEGKGRLRNKEKKKKEEEKTTNRMKELANVVDKFLDPRTRLTLIRRYPEES